MGKKLEIKAGDKFGKWTVLEETEPQISPCGAKTRMFKCRCECGTVRNVSGYYPWNCRWTDRKRQVRNTSRTRRYNGEALADLYDRECDCGITYKSFYDRVRRGWDVQTALHKVTRKSRRGVK